MAQKEKDTASSKLSDYIGKNKKVIIIAGVVIIAGVLIFTLVNLIGNKVKSKNLNALDQIENSYVSDIASLEGDELKAKQDEVLKSLEAYTGKSGVVGTRANMLSAEIAFASETYDSAVKFYEAATKQKKVYTAPVVYYNAGVCYEKLGMNDKAEEAYKTASSFEDFVLYAHAMFSYGRILEAEGKVEDAVKVYTELNDKQPNDEWAKIAKTRIIALQLTAAE